MQDKTIASVLSSLLGVDSDAFLKDIIADGCVFELGLP